MDRNRVISEERNFDRLLQEYIRLCNEYNETHSLFLQNQYNLLNNIYNRLHLHSSNIQRDRLRNIPRRQPTTQTRETHENNEHRTRYSRLFNETLINELSRIIPRNQIRTYRINLDVGDSLDQLFNMEDVPIIPSREQVENATEELTYGSYVQYQNENNLTICEQCPIDLQSFEENEPLLKIKHCGHVFKKNNLLQWFTRNTKCPVCRYDIREYSNTTTDNSNNIQSETINDNTYINIFRSIFPDVSFSTIR